MQDLASWVSIDGVNNAVINGTGGAQPVGIKATPGIRTGQDASTATYARVLASPSAAGTVTGFGALSSEQLAEAIGLCSRGGVETSYPPAPFWITSLCG